MILLISDSSDNVIHGISDWLRELKTKFIFIECLRFLEYIESVVIDNDITRICFNVGGVRFRLADVSCVYFRRVSLETPRIKMDRMSWNVTELDVPKDVMDLMIKTVKLEEQRLKEFIYDKIQNSVPTLGHWKNNRINKLQVLESARKVGLNIIKSTISKENIGDVSHISKPMSNCPSFYIPEIRASAGAYTTNVRKSPHSTDIHQYFQRKLHKLYEVRSFIIGENIISTAILSKENEQTSTDYRKYDFQNPNVVVPYNLPLEVEEKLIGLVKLLDIGTGSADLICSKHGTYNFLEINPVGQIGMVESPTNFAVHKLLAEHIISLV